MQTTEVHVWDPFVRVCHWLLAIVVIIAWLTDEPLWLHTWLGYIAALLVVLRVGWGVIGPENARFASFVHGPSLVFGYLADLIRLSPKRYVGHSPAGGAMIVALLFMVAVTASTGMVNLAADRGEGPLAGLITKVERPGIRSSNGNDRGRREELLIKEIHETAANIMLVLVAFHVAGVIFASITHRENLVRSMITGRKRAE